MKTLDLLWVLIEGGVGEGSGGSWSKYGTDVLHEEWVSFFYPAVYVIPKAYEMRIFYTSIVLYDQ